MATAKVRLSGEKARPARLPGLGSRVLPDFPDARSQRETAAILLPGLGPGLVSPAATIFPSGENATAEAAASIAKTAVS